MENIRNTIASALPNQDDPYHILGSAYLEFIMVAFGDKMRVEHVFKTVMPALEEIIWSRSSFDKNKLVFISQHVMPDLRKLLRESVPSEPRPLCEGLSYQPPCFQELCYTWNKITKKEGEGLHLSRAAYERRDLEFAQCATSPTTQDKGKKRPTSIALVEQPPSKLQRTGNETDPMELVLCLRKFFPSDPDVLELLDTLAGRVQRSLIATERAPVKQKLTNEERKAKAVLDSRTVLNSLAPVKDIERCNGDLCYVGDPSLNFIPSLVFSSNTTAETLKNLNSEAKDEEAANQLVNFRKYKLAQMYAYLQKEFKEQAAAKEGPYRQKDMWDWIKSYSPKGLNDKSIPRYLNLYHLWSEYPHLMSISIPLEHALHVHEQLKKANVPSTYHLIPPLSRENHSTISIRQSFGSSP